MFNHGIKRKKSDWNAVPASKRSRWQRLAARTNGSVTPGNLVTCSGLVLSLVGIALIGNGSLSAGLVYLIAGRVADILDGFAADATKTKSRVGEAFDAGADKVVAIAAVLVFWAGNVIPRWPLLLILLFTVLTIAFVAIGRLRDHVVHPSLAGKFAAFAQWLGIFLFLIARLLAPHMAGPAQLLRVCAITLFVIFAGLSLAAISRYARQALGSAAPHLAPGLRGQFTRIVIIANPVSTNAQRIKRRTIELHRLLPHAEVLTIETSPDGRFANRALIRSLAKQLGPHTLLCIAAGDGTMNVVVESLLAEPTFSSAQRRTPILPLWCGNANDLAHMLNGRPSPGKLRRVFAYGRLSAIHPLACTFTVPGGQTKTYFAACYASFGASAYTTQVLSKSVRKNAFPRHVPFVRMVQELLLVVKAMSEAPTFQVEEESRPKRVFEYIFFNGPRLAKVTGVRRRLGDRTFHRAVVERKRFWDIMSTIGRLMRRRTASQFERTQATFTAIEDAWAQVDGETIRVAAGTKVSITIAAQTFCALNLFITSTDERA